VERVRGLSYCVGIVVVGVLGAAAAWAQTPPVAASAEAPAGTYQPKFPGDPARSESEAQALAYMRTALRAEREYKKRHDKYTASLADLAGTGSFTKRMAQTPNRGDYTASYRQHHDRPDHDGFVFTMTPLHLDAEHRSFYAEDDMVIHADDQKAADLSSPKVK
jgi:hypothetical protein